MIFTDKEHEDFYKNTIAEYMKYGGELDCYSRPFFYLMGICRDTRENFGSLFSIKEHCIIPENFNSAWQTGTSYKICRLAFNLWNGFCYKCDNESNEKIISSSFSVDEIFCCEYAEYFFEAIRLRYPCYCHK